LGISTAQDERAAKRMVMRDNICFIIEAEGGSVDCKILNNEEYKTELIRKMHEETDEYAKDLNIEELADMWEVYRNIILQSGYKFNEVLKVAKEKREKKGSFRDKIFLNSFEL
jgi:predicted house-cleaning noncanonical NTP pyrophosphatase (MazG superfamily)